MSVTGSSSTEASAALLVAPAIEYKNILKIAQPDLYYRDRAKLRVFLTQVKLYTGFNRHQFPTKTDKVL